jgi:putative membrane protein
MTMRNKEYRLQHPLAIIDAFFRYIILLLLPLVRSITLFTTDLRTWLQGVWIDVLVLLAIILFGTLRWNCIRVRIEEDGVLHRAGIWMIREQRIPFSHISSVIAEHSWYLRPFSAVRVRIETDAGNDELPDVRLLLREKDADALLAGVSGYLRDEQVMVRRYEPRSLYVGLLSFVTSDSLTGVLFAATLISQTGKLLGEEAEDRLITSLTRMMELAASWLPPVAAIIGCTLLGGWLIDFVSNLIRHLRFRAVRQGSALFVRCGIFTEREYTLAAERVNFLQLRQSLLTRLIGYYAGMINCTGYGKGKNELSVLLPAVGEDDLRRSLNLILPELRPTGNRWHPPARTLWRILWPALLLCTVVGFTWRTALRWLPSLWELVLFLGAMLMLPSIWWLMVRLVSFFHTGIGCRKDTFTFRGVSGFRFFTIVCRADKIAKMQVTRTIFQQQNGCGDLRIWFRSEKKRSLLVPNLRIEDIDRFLQTVEHSDLND